MAKDKFDMLMNEDTKEVVSNASAKVDNLKELDKKKVITNIRLEKYRLDKLKAYAANRGMSINAVVINALVESDII